MQLASLITRAPAAAPLRLRPHLAAGSPGRRRLLVRAAAAGQPEQSDSSGGSSGGSSDSGSGKRSQPRDAGGRFKHSTEEPQPQLQAWLQQEQGLSAADADQHARRLALVFGSQQAALYGLPATFEWCRGRGLPALETAQLLDRIAFKRQDSVVQFAALVQPVWQQIDSHIAAYVEPLRQAGARLPKHTSLAGKLGSSLEYSPALAMPPGHVEVWLAAVSQQLPAAAIGRLLLTQPNVTTGSPATAAAAISWAVDVLGVMEPAAFVALLPALLTYEAPTLQRNFNSLQQALGWTAQQARQLAIRHPSLLGMDLETVCAAYAWLQQLFPDADQLAGVISRGPQLLTSTEQHLRCNADALRAALGWQDGDGQLAAFVAAYPQPFAIVNLGGEDTQHKLRLLSEVVGVSAERCLSKGSTYLKTRDETMAAHYMLVQDRAPHLLFNKAGQLQLSWVSGAVKPRFLDAMGMTRPEYNAFVREWPRSEEGRRLLEGLRAGSVDGWPRPISFGQAAQRQQAKAEQRRQAKAAQLALPCAALRRARQRRWTTSGRARGGVASSRCRVALRMERQPSMRASYCNLGTPACGATHIVCVVSGLDLWVLSIVWFMQNTRLSE